MGSGSFLKGLCPKVKMKKARTVLILSAILPIIAIFWNLGISQAEAQLPSGVKAVWELEKAYRGLALGDVVYYFTERKEDQSLTEPAEIAGKGRVGLSNWERADWIKGGFRGHP